MLLGKNEHACYSDISQALLCRGSTLNFQRPVTHPYGAPAIPSCSQRASVAHVLPANRQMLHLLLLQNSQKPAPGKLV